MQGTPETRYWDFPPSQGNIEKMLSINEINDITMKAVKDWMKPELLSRVTAVIPFVES
jgi:ATP-dependent Clp protease ATP-binding subunit ClpA